jgi:hypothetical protein
VRTKSLRVPWPEAAILIIAAVNFAHLWWLALVSPGERLVTSNWYYPPILVQEPSRLLLAAALLLVARRGFRLVAMVLAAQPLLYIVYEHLDAHSFQFCFDRSSQSYLMVVQGALAGAVVGLTAFRLLAGVVKRSRGLGIGLIILLVLSSLGWVSSVLATGRCEEIAADFVAREVYGGERFAVVEDRDAWLPPEDVFRRVGAHVVEWKPFGPRDGVGSVRLSPALHPLPFVVRVQYDAIFYSTGGSAERTDRGRLLFFAGPGFVVRLKSAEPWWKWIDVYVLRATVFPWQELVGLLSGGGASHEQ